MSMTLTALSLAGAMMGSGPTLSLPNDTRFRMAPLVSDLPGIAPILDPDLVNPWGISRNIAGGPFWVANAGTSTSTLYSGDINGSPFVKSALVVDIPGALPTGTVFNAAPEFTVTAGGVTARAFFLFVSITGNVTAWSPGVPPPAPSTTAHIVANVPDAVYTGMTTGNNGTANFLYAANVAQGRIDVFDSAYQLATLGKAAFTDPALPAGFSPFNVENLGGSLYVAYLGPGAEPGEFSGIVNKFDMNGAFVARIATGGPLNEPWGMAIAPANFGSFSNALLVGNFGNGRIHGYDLSTGRLLGALKGKRGGPIRVSGLWAILFGNGVSTGDTNALYFSAGIDGEEHGLLGKIVVDP